MRPTDLLAHLNSLGVVLTRIGPDTLGFEGPTDVLTEALLDAIRAVKPALLAVLPDEGPVTSAASGVEPSVAPGDDGRGVWLRAMGELFGWPCLQIGPGAAVAAGREAWITFTSYPQNDEWVGQAVAVLSEVGDLVLAEIEPAAEAWWRCRAEGRRVYGAPTAPKELWRP